MSEKSELVQRAEAECAFLEAVERFLKLNPTIEGIEVDQKALGRVRLIVDGQPVPPERFPAVDMRPLQAQREGLEVFLDRTRKKILPRSKVGMYVDAQQLMVKSMVARDRTAT